MLVNGKNYSWGSITVVINGVVYAGITEINYKRMQAKENNYGIGETPISRGYGNKTYEGSITFYLDTWESIKSASPNNDPTSLPFFDVIVQYAPTSLGILVKKHTLKACEFLEDGVSVAQGDTKILVPIPVIYADIVNS